MSDLLSRTLLALATAILCLAAAQGAPAGEGQIPDPRHIANGRVIVAGGYADQPYVVRTDDGAWLVCVTVGSGREGEPGQHVVTFRSMDQGRSWKGPVDVEPATGPEASYAVMWKAPAGRVYVFYNHNTDNIRRIKAEPPAYPDGWCRRVDSQGYFVFKFSDDHGKTWSPRRYRIPVREFEIDRKNAYGGRIRFFWNVGKPFTLGEAAYVPLIKVGGFGEGFFTSNEGVLLRSDNILTERDPERIRWVTLPDGDIGLRAPPGGGPIAAEQSYAVLSDGSIYCVYRTIDGYPAFSYSRDGGHTWDVPRYQRYADGRLMKHPRAANFVWKASNGKYLYWFHNNGGRFIREHPRRRTYAFQNRNPAWLSGGVEADSPAGKVIRWSQPEIVLYADDPRTRMSYPDFMEEDGKYYLTETEKVAARVHEIAGELIEGLWNQFENRTVAQRGLVLDVPEAGSPIPDSVPLPRLPLLRERAGHGSKNLRNGFSVGLWFRLNSLQPGQLLLDSRLENGQGWCLRTTDRRTIEIVLNDGRTENSWDCDPGLIEAGKLHHLVVVVDGGPSIVTFIVDGKLCDGAEYRQFGWGRFSPNLEHANGDTVLRVAPALEGEVEQVRVYDRRLTTSEAIGNYGQGR